MARPRAAVGTECEAVRLRVAQIVKVQAGCVAIWQRLGASGRPAC